MRLVTIDPGKTIGWATFYDDRFIGADVIDAERLHTASHMLHNLVKAAHPDLAIIEKPQVYPQRNWKGDPNDLINVAIIAGAAAAILMQTADIAFVKPHEWKGNRPKKIDNEYTLGKMTTAERELLERCNIPKGKLEHVLDAIGIALWQIGRR